MATRLWLGLAGGLAAGGTCSTPAALSCPARGAGSVRAAGRGIRYGEGSVRSEGGLAAGGEAVDGYGGWRHMLPHDAGASVRSSVHGRCGLHVRAERRATGQVWVGCWCTGGMEWWAVRSRASPSTLALYCCSVQRWDRDRRVGRGGRVGWVRAGPVRAVALRLRDA